MQIPSSYRIWQPALLGVTVALGMMAGVKMVPKLGNQYHPTLDTVMVLDQDDKIEEVLKYIDAKYIDTVHRGELVDETIRAIIDQLDPHSNYLTAKEVALEAENHEGHYSGIGAEFFFVQDTPIILRTVEASPAERAGLNRGDAILAINGTNTLDFASEFDKLSDLIREPSQPDLRIAVRRSNATTIDTILVTRDLVPTNSVDHFQMLSGQVGYIRVRQFSMETYRQFMVAVENLVQQQKAKDLVIDLRGNPGGYLQQVVQILSQLFIEKDKLLVYTVTRNGQKREYRSTGQAFFPVNKIAILVDEGSASASEILAGAVQDWDRGILVGRRTFGKGLVQKEFPLGDGSALLLTIERYYTPLGRLIQKSYQDREAYRQDLYDRSQHGELTDAAQIPVLDSTPYKTPKGKILYARGGIYPDVFVPLDSFVLSPEYQSIEARMYSWMYQLARDYPELSGYQEADQYVNWTRSHNWKRELQNALGKSVRWPSNMDRTVERLMLDRMLYYFQGPEMANTFSVNHDECVEKALSALSK